MKTLLEALRSRDRAAIQSLLSIHPQTIDAPIREADTTWPTPMMIAAADGWIEGVLLLAGLGADPNAQGRWGRTPFHAAAIRCPDPAMIQTVHKAGADPDAADEDGLRALHIAARIPERACLIAPLAEAGADLAATDCNGWTPLHYAVEEDQIAAAQTLLAFGANPNAPDEDGRTPLWLACIDPDRRIDLVSTLLSHGADPNIKKSSGLGALDAAIIGQNACAIRLLVQAGADASHNPRREKFLADRPVSLSALEAAVLSRTQGTAGGSNAPAKRRI